MTCAHNHPPTSTAAELFFYDHAGYSYDPATETPDDGRLRTAHELAIAERWAHDCDALRFVWHDDWDVGSHIKFYGPDAYDHEPSTCEYVHAWLGNDVVASLGCIDDATDEYRRVIEAELAQEAYTLLLSDLERI